MLTKFEVSRPSRFQDIANKNQLFSTYISAAFLSILWQKNNFGKVGLLIENHLILQF